MEWLKDNVANLVLGLFGAGFFTQWLIGYQNKKKTSADATLTSSEAKKTVEESKDIAYKRLADLEERSNQRMNEMHERIEELSKQVRVLQDENFTLRKDILDQTQLLKNQISKQDSHISALEKIIRDAGGTYPDRPVFS